MFEKMISIHTFEFIFVLLFVMSKIVSAFSIWFVATSNSVITTK
jgi:hypothetical protein